MEKGADASNRLSTWDKKISSSSSSSSSNSDAAPSMKTHTTTQTQPFLPKAFMFHNKGIDLDRPFDVGGANEALGNINRDDNVSSSGNFANAHCRSSSNLQAFDMFPPASVYSTTPYKSPGGNGMAATVGFPFTSAQWGELERQAMIYKYMMCSVPVPPELLFPLTRNFPDSSASPLYNVRCARNGDPEPGRCKRTDGKKWRCSRDVAPHQKYCERHLHRGRPRSRKPVEVKSSSTNGGESSHKKTRLEQASRPASLPTPTPTPAPVSSQQVVSATANDSSLLLFNSKTDVTISTRDLGLMMEAGMVNVNTDEQRWQLLMGSNVGFSGEGSSSIHGSTTLFDQDYVDQHHHNHHHALNVFAAPGIEAPAGFIDAWSIDNNLNSTNNGNTMSTNQGSLSPSLNLSMAMAVGNPLDQGVGKVQLESHEDNSYKNWLGRPVSWQPFAQGGPLAEALHLGSVYAYPASPHDSIGTPATTVSSPSGVLQRTFFSHSDSSVCNSPTFAAHASEVAFPRFNHND